MAKIFTMGMVAQNCPSCYCENFHPMPPRLEGTYETSGADYAVIIPYWCENGCKGEMRYHHHEGMCTFSISKTNDTEQEQSQLWAHCVSRHCAIMDPKTSLNDLRDFHEHEHDGPGTIRNHDRADRSYSLKKIGQVLSDSEA
jgi:hypothetical protein